MEKNVGSADKAVRIAVGAALVLGGVFAPVDTVVRGVFFVLAAVALSTAFYGW